MGQIEKLVQNAQHGKMTRRTLLQSLAATAAAAALPFEAEALPSFKPIWISHYTYTAPDMKKTVDWYMEVFAMQKGQSNAKETHLWYGDTLGDTLMIVKQAQAGDVSPGITKFGFTVDHWDKTSMEAALKQRGLNPQADTDKGFWFKDPEGNEIGVFAKDWIKRPSGGAPKVTTWKALSSNHIVVTSADYKKLANWYLELFAFNQTTDGGRDVYQWVGDTAWIPTAVGEGRQASAVLKTLDHVAYTIENYQSAPVAKELIRRGMIKADNPEASSGSIGINCVDVNQFKTQVCAWNVVPNSDRGRLAGPQGGRGGERGERGERGQRRP